MPVLSGWPKNPISAAKAGPHLERDIVFGGAGSGMVGGARPLHLAGETVARPAYRLFTCESVEEMALTTL
ncbi:MAG: hypothetical protein HY682_12490 [Chloroflexi bacterium]|nr:hypothetical protein [Chloroflexota bacterium]